MSYALEARAIHRRYGGVHALKGVDFDLRAGEVHALIGANGAGKSTLCKIIAGIEAPSEGELLLAGQPIRFASVRDAAAQGIDIVHQELSLFPELTVAENLFMGREKVGALGFIDGAAQKAQASQALARLGQPVDPEARLGSLSIGMRQIVEIAKALVHDTRVLLMDEPTSALSRAEIPVLFEVIRSLTAQGVAVVYISHRLDELLEISDRVTVLRDGKVVARADSSKIDTAWIVREMTGTEMAPPAKGAAVSGEPVLTVADLSLPPREGRAALEGVSLQVRAGEVVGLYGLMGAGRTELFETLMGLHRDAEGVQRLGETDLSGLDVAERIDAGLAMAPEDRQRDGLLANFSILQNMTLSSLHRLAGLWRREPAERAAAGGLVEALKIKLSSLDNPVHSLSGGNQQKVVLSRCLMSGPRMLLLDEPARGVDVAAKAEILAQMRVLASDGAGVMFASSDLSDIFTASTRIIVMSRGRIALEVSPDQATETMLAEAAAVDAETPVQELTP